MASNVKVIRLIFSGYFLFGILFHSHAQKIEKQQVDSLWWKQKTEKVGYAEEQLPSDEIVFNPGSLPSWFQSPIFKYVNLILIIFILLFVLFKLFGKGLFIKDLKEEYSAPHLLSDGDLDNRFYEMDLDLLLEKAVSNRNWAMAIRIRFFMVLKKLIEQQHIVWHKDLTNRQIAWQIRHQDRRNDFFDLIGYFEQVWYGDKQVSLEYFKDISTMFEDFNRTIQPNDKK